MNLKQDVVRLAQENPELRKHLLPLVRKGYGSIPDRVQLIYNRFKDDFPRHVPGRIYPRSKMPIVVKWLKKQTRDKYIAEQVFDILFKGTEMGTFDKYWGKTAASRSDSVESVLGRIRDMSWRISHDIVDAKEALAPRRGMVGEKDIKLALGYLKNAGDLADQSADLAVGTLRALPRTAASPGKAQSMTKVMTTYLRKLKRYGFDNLAYEMENITESVESGFLRPDLAREAIQKDLSGELGAAVQLGDVTTKREFQQIEDLLLGWAKLLLGKDAPRKLEYPSEYKRDIQKLGSRSMGSLRQAVIKLARENPNLRQHLVPLLRKGAEGKTARVPSKLDSQGRLRELQKKHGGRTKSYYAAALKELKAGNLAPGAVVGGGYKDNKKVAIKWLEEQMRKAKSAARGDEMEAGREHGEGGKGYGMTGPDVRGKGKKPPEAKGKCYYETGDEGDRCYTTTKGGPKGPRDEKTYTPGMSAKERWKRYEEVRWGE